MERRNNRASDFSRRLRMPRRSPLVAVFFLHIWPARTKAPSAKVKRTVVVNQAKQDESYGHASSTTQSNFTLVHGNAHCCHADPRHNLGRVVGQLRRPMTLASCQARCLDDARCTFLSLSVSKGHAAVGYCDLCSSCDLVASGRLARYASWVRAAAAWTPKTSCFLPQTAHSCECSALNLRTLPSHLELPECDPTAECAPAVRPLEHVAAQELPPPPPPSSPDTATSSASIVLVYGFYRDRVRTWYTADPMRSYLNAMRLMFRLVLSLRRVRTTLPIHLLPSGDRFEPFEQWLRAHGVRILPPAEGPRFAFRVPGWSSVHHRGAFSHLMALALTQFKRIIVLDIDTFVLRNIDHLAFTPAPAFVYRWKCYPRLELNSGLMVLEPSEREHARMQAFLNGPLVSKGSFPAHEDYNTQSVWRRFYRRVFELPVSYNAFRSTALTHEGWNASYVLHDVDMMRTSRSWSAGAEVQATFGALTREANHEVQAVCGEANITNRG